MLMLSALFARLSVDPSDSGLLSQLLVCSERDDPEIQPYYESEDASCRQALTALFARPSTPIRWLNRLAVSQVLMRHRLDEERPIEAPLLGALADDPLCLLIL